MDEKVSKIESRLKNMREFYEKTTDIIDKLPDVVSTKTKDALKKTILGDKELKNLMEGVDSNRPPRIFMIGRTGVGKSSLINAICGAYVAKVSDTTSCTETTRMYKCESEDRVLMEVFDTRGIAETEAIESEVTAENILVDQINEFSPDVAIYMLNCTRRDDVNYDVEFLKKVAKSYYEKNNMRLPIIVVVNKSDDMAPSRLKESSEYPKTKTEKIGEIVSSYQSIIEKHGLEINGIIATSSLIEWMTSEGEPVEVEDIDVLSQAEIDNLQLYFDGRYQIDKLLDMLGDTIQGFDVQMGLRMATRLNDVIDRLAGRLITIFSSISAVVALTPIPISDIYVLMILQAVMVALIASLSGRDMTLDDAQEFIASLGGIVGSGYMFNLTAQQLTKLVNPILPGTGSAISSAVAVSGTMSIGNAARFYYIEGNSIEMSKISKAT